MNVNIYNTTDYENIWHRKVRKNKPNSNPIKANLKRAKMNISYVKTTNYEQKTMNYANNKQTQFKPNFRKAQNERKRFYHKGL